MRIRKYMPASIEETVNIIVNRLLIAKELLRRKPNKLSAGQKQLVGIGRAMTIIPGILLMDEPMAHIDPQHRLTLRRELKEYHSKMETITLYVSHNLPEAFSLADRVAIMQEGRIIQVDSPEGIFSHPANDFVKDFIQCFEM
jgi:ABC-type proline/glycine betaine transport system ATPase subunit